VVINQTQPIPVTIEPPHNTGTNAVFSTIGEKVAEALPYGLGIVAAYTAFKTGASRCSKGAIGGIQKANGLYRERAEKAN
jgi:hypothetical protein